MKFFTKNKNRVTKRLLQIESLEQREMLTVAPLLYSIYSEQSQYSTDFNTEAIAAPTVSDITATSLKLTWNASTLTGLRPEEPFKIERSTVDSSGTEKWTQIGSDIPYSYTIGNGTYSCELKDLTTSTEYKLRISFGSTVLGYGYTDAVTVSTLSSEIKAEAVSSTSIKLSWNIAGKTGTSFTVKKRLAGTTTWEDTGITVKADGSVTVTKTCTVDSLTPAKKYEFQVSYYDTTNVLRTSQVTECTTLYVLTSSNNTLNSVNLSWDDAMGGTSHEVQIYTGTTKPTTTTVWTKATAESVSSNEYKVTGLKENASYYFRVRYNVTENSETVTKYTDVLSYSSPTSIKLDNVTENSIDVSWTFSVQSGTSYYIQTSAAGADGTWSDYPGANTVNKSYTLKNLDSGKEYYVRVRYFSPAGAESFSAAEHITTGIATKLESVTQDSATVSWSIPGLTTPVNIQRCDGSLDPAIDTNWRTIATNISGTSYTNSNIGSSNKYYYRISYESGGETKYTIYVTALTIGTVTVSDPSMDTVKLDWNFKPKQGTSLIIQQFQGNSVPTSDSAWGTASITLDSDNQGCTVKNLTPGLNYFFRVRYTSELGTVEQTTNATKIVMTVGTNLTASETNATSVTLRWAKTGFTQQKDKNFTVYQRDLSGANGTDSNWREIATISSDQNTYIVTNLLGDTQYQFKIGYQGESESQAVSAMLELITKPYTADILNLSQNSAQLLWTFDTDKDPASNTSSTGDNTGTYIVQKYIGNGEPGETERLLAVNDANWQEIGTCIYNMSPQPRYNLEGLTKNTTYYYRIVYTYRTGNIEDGPGSTYIVPLETKFSEIVTLKTQSDLWTTNIGSYSVNLAWDAKTLNSGTQYSVQYQIKGAGTWTTASSSVAAASYTCNNLLADTDYEFRVVFNGGSETATIEAKTSKSILSVVAKELGIGTASATIEMQYWTGESNFVLYYRPKGDETASWSQKSPTTTSSGNVSFQLSLTPETEYELKIVYDSNSVSHESEIKFVSLSDDLMPSNVSGNSITIRWDDSSFPDKRSGSSYILQYRVAESGTVWSTAPTPSNNSSVVNNLSANTEYEFRVQYTTDGGATAYSTIKTARTKQPVISLSTPQVKKVKLTWTFESVSGYVIQYKAADGTWTNAATLTENSLRETTIDNLTKETDYTFRIAYKTAQSGTDFVYSDEAEITTLGGFTVVENSTGSQSITVKWDYVTDSTYRLQYKVKGTQIWIETISDILKSTKEYTISSLDPGNSYTIRLTYFDGMEGYEEINATTTKTPPETPTGLTVSEITGSSAKIKWVDNSVYEDDYTIEITNNVTKITDKISAGDGLGTGDMTYMLTGLDTKISYTVKVYAKNAEGSSAAVQTTFTTLDVSRPAAVTSVKAAATPKSITLSWKIKSVTDIPDPTNFRIEYYDDKDKNREKLWYEVQGLSSTVVYDSATQTYSCTISNSFVIGDSSNSLTVTLENKTSYQFRIIALAPSSTSTSTFGDSSAATIKATTAALVVPSSLAAKNITLTTATVSFKDTDKNVSPTDKTYTLYYVAGAKKYSKWEDVPVSEIQSVIVPSDKLSYDLTGLKAETIYTYIIESDYFGQKTVTKTSSFTTAKMPTATTIKGGYTLVTNKYSFLISWKPPVSTKLSAGITIQYTLEVSTSGKKDTFITLPSSTVGTSSAGLKYVTFLFSDVLKLLADNNYDISTKISGLSFRVASTFIENNTVVGTSYSTAGRVTLPKFV